MRKEEAGNILLNEFVQVDIWTRRNRKDKQILSHKSQEEVEGYQQRLEKTRQIKKEKQAYWFYLRYNCNLFI